MMTRIVLEQMKARRKGAIVNVSSGSELQPLPLMTVYAASKVPWTIFPYSVKFKRGKLRDEVAIHLIFGLHSLRAIEQVNRSRINRR